LNDYRAGVADWCDVSNMQKGKVEKDSNLIGWSGAFRPNNKDSAPLALISDNAALVSLFGPAWAWINI
jgi:hypothetical protein